MFTLKKEKTRWAMVMVTMLSPLFFAFYSVAYGVNISQDIEAKTTNPKATIAFAAGEFENSAGGSDDTNPTLTNDTIAYDNADELNELNLEQDYSEYEGYLIDTH